MNRKHTMDNEVRKEILRAMIISCYKEKLISLQEYTEMIHELDQS